MMVRQRRRDVAAPAAELLQALNPEQREAVTTLDGPVLVLAGAGTGKTRVITYRVAYLLAQGVPAEAVLAVTFTNKAAEEMKQRIGQLVRGCRTPWVGTFHSFAAWLLRQDGPRIGIPREFAIYDEEDQLRLLRRALEESGQGQARWPLRELREVISRAKNRGWDAPQLAEQATDELTRAAARLLPVYQALLARASALDFDDLLLRAVELLRTQTAVRERWARRFRYLLVDEYQDINALQRELTLLLASQHRNVCVVGDEDQAIYSWRGADPGLFLRFQQDFPEARLIRLERNYRSTPIILEAANAVIAHNLARLGKTLRAEQPGGVPLSLYTAADPQQEAAFVVQALAQRLAAEPEARLAVLYRTGFQSRLFEEGCQRARLRYRVLGGFSFYRRAEIKDLLAYLRLVLHPEDDAALERVLNVPPRGIGEVTLERLRHLASQQRRPLWEVLVEQAQQRAALASFRQLIEELRAARQQLAPAALLERIVDRTGYLRWLEQRASAQPEDEDRLANVRELLAALEAAQQQGEPLESFLDRVALVSDADAFDPSVPVTLMTLHSAKGLEFDHVFLVGLEEGLLPHARAAQTAEGIEEERRLLYVGMTRARRSLTLSWAMRRHGREAGGFFPTTPSRFLVEIPARLLVPVAGASPEFLAAVGQRVFRADPMDEERAPTPSTRRSRRAPIRVGARVRHPTFGVGTVVAIEHDGEDRKITVQFADHGPRKLIERYAGLRPA